MKWLRGYITCRVSAGRWERFMNLCRHHGIKLWDIKVDKRNVTFCMYSGDYRILMKFVKKTNVVPHVCKRRGLPFLCNRAVRDWTFTLGLVLFFGVLRVLSMFVWQINYYGQQEYTKETLSREVMSMGVYTGMFRSKLNCDSIERSLRERYENMSWVSAEEKGCVLNIKIKEGTAEKKKEEADTQPCHLVAPCKGVVRSIVTREGTAQVKRGMKVKKGDILISGIVEIRDDSDTVIRKNGVHAEGDVVLATEKKYEDSINISYTAKNKTGEDIRVFTVQCNDIRFSIKNPLKWFDNSANYDIMNDICVDEQFIPLHTGLKVTERRYISYQQVPAEYSETEAEKLLRNRLESKIAGYEEKGYKILDHTFAVSREPSSFQARGNISMEISTMRQKAVKEKELTLGKNGKEDEDGTGADHT